ncbi:MAG: nitrilase-related carbon-nitrogen hydrolase [Thermotogota bacterium]|nr:nitrilase-related carbon-nitrogen hydrolase [Thermotogota bacterium]
MKIDLTAIQTEIDLKDYRNPESFMRSMNDSLIKASQLWKSNIHLAVFPEFIGTFLYPGMFLKSLDNQNVFKLLLKYIFKNFLLSQLNFFRAAFLKNALKVEEIYRNTFSELAKNYSSYIVAPSILLPSITFESSKGRYITDKRLFNMSYLFNPKGQVIARMGKLRLTPSENKILFSPYPYRNQAVKTEFAKIAVVICYDMFFQDTIEHLDSIGAQILAVPTCNFAYWKKPVKYNSSYSQERIWWLDGPIKATKKRENIQFLINAMAVGKIGNNVAEGRSTIWNNGRICKLARSWTSSEEINATVEI